MRFRLLAFLSFLFSLWGISHLAAQDVDISGMTSLDAYAVLAAHQAKPELGRPKNWSHDGLLPTDKSNLSCELAPGTEMGRTVYPYKVRLTYPDDVYVVLVTGDGLTQLCDPKFGDAVTGPQANFDGLPGASVPAGDAGNIGEVAQPSATPIPTSTIDPNLPTAIPTNTALPTATQFLGTPLAQDYVCPQGFSGYLKPRLNVGIQTASVTAGRVGNRLRAEPNTGSMQVGVADPEAILDRVITGPACFEDYVWWLVEIDGMQGWTAESSTDKYFLEPQIGITSTPIQPTAAPTSVSIDPDGMSLAGTSCPAISILDYIDEVNEPTWTGEAFELAGAETRVQIDLTSAPDFGASDVSFSVWVTRALTQFEVVFDKRSSRDTVQGIALFFTSDNAIGLQLADGPTDQHTFQESWTNYTSGVFVNDTEWHMITVTLDRDNAEGGRIYLDGEFRETFNPTDRAGSLSTTAPLSLGRRSFSEPAYFYGSIKGLRFYPCLLTHDEIKQLLAGQGLETQPSADLQPVGPQSILQEGHYTLSGTSSQCLDGRTPRTTNTISNQYDVVLTSPYRVIVTGMGGQKYDFDIDDQLHGITADDEGLVEISISPRADFSLVFSNTDSNCTFTQFITTLSQDHRVEITPIAEVIPTATPKAQTTRVAVTDGPLQEGIYVYSGSDSGCFVSQTRPDHNILSDRYDLIIPSHDHITLTGDKGHVYEFRIGLTHGFTTDGDMPIKISIFSRTEFNLSFGKDCLYTQHLTLYQAEQGSSETPQATIAATAVPTATSTPFPTYCPASPPSRIQVGIVAGVTYAVAGEVREDLRVRATPNGDRIGAMSEGTQFRVIGGYECAGDRIWWQIETLDQSLKGWVTEGAVPDDYYIEPVSN